MIGAGTLRVQTKLGAKLTRVLADYGQDVAILRSGQDDTVTRAYLYQLDDKAATGNVSQPEFRMPAWQGVFHADAPLQGHFAVRDAAGRVFVPDSDPQDGGTQGVAWVVHLLPAPERVRVDHLIFTTPGTSTKDARTGNQVVAGTGTPLPPSPARLVASTDPRVREMAGADRADVVLVGRWGTLLQPLLKPDGLSWGSTAPLALDGRPGVLTLNVTYPDDDVVQERHFGSRFIGTWRAT